VKWFNELPAVYLHRNPVDFRKAINGLCVIVEQEMAMSPYDASLFVFCNRNRDKLKILHWDKTGFVLWYKRLEVIQVNEQSLHWLLTGLAIYPPKPHQTLHYQSIV